MAHYDMLAILPGTLAEDELPTVIEVVEKQLASEGATNIKTVLEGKDRLAYPMKHIRYGYFYNIRFETEPQSVQKMQNKLRLIPELLRSLINGFDLEEKAAYDKRLKEVKDISAKHVKEKEEAVAKEAEEAPAEMVAEAKEASKPKKEEAEKDTKKVSMEEIDKKLDDILDANIG